MSIEDPVVSSDLGVLRSLALALADDLPPETDQDAVLEAAVRRAARSSGLDEQDQVAPFQSTI